MICCKLVWNSIFGNSETNILPYESYSVIIQQAHVLWQKARERKAKQQSTQTSFCVTPLNLLLCNTLSIIYLYLSHRQRKLRHTMNCCRFQALHDNAFDQTACASGWHAKMPFGTGLKAKNLSWVNESCPCATVFPGTVECELIHAFIIWPQLWSPWCWDRGPAADNHDALAGVDAFLPAKSFSLRTSQHLIPFSTPLVNNPTVPSLSFIFQSFRSLHTSLSLSSSCSSSMKALVGAERLYKPPFCQQG